MCTTLSPDRWMDGWIAWFIHWLGIGFSSARGSVGRRGVSKIRSECSTSSSNHSRERAHTHIHSHHCCLAAQPHPSIHPSVHPSIYSETVCECEAVVLWFIFLTPRWTLRRSCRTCWWSLHHNRGPWSSSRSCRESTMPPRMRCVSSRLIDARCSRRCQSLPPKPLRYGP